MDTGIEPVRELPALANFKSTADSDPIPVGIVPVMPKLDNSRSVTTPAPQVTPSHSTPVAHGSVEVKPATSQTHIEYPEMVAKFVAATRLHKALS
jgi:hypothetical protein